ncbi:STE3-like pheromone receptor [Dendrothele bispora CBS 962.96]|uniref:STE3-like pheromone receptor n=1 Tax=Dendrothele bispora (strain CBS 962.96) TaxID=1314807 RepID=A0A4S8L5F6_DENBC|nr:STE3-like pheromone receptor [Dendrothele bispora CBS 962.96]
MYDPTYPAFPVMAFIGFILVLVPLPWHLQAWNSGTCLFMIWTALGCLNQFINSVVWRNDAIDRAPYWCDISTALTVAINVAIPATSLCINRRLYNIASCQTASISKADKRRQVMIDLAIGIGLPILQLPLHLVVQGHRYDIMEQIGCWPTTYNTVPAYPLSFVWPNVIGLVSMVYGVLTLRAFMKRRQQFSQFLSTGSGISVGRYFRLMCLAMVEIFINTPISAYGLYLNATHSQIHPWISWENTHFGFNIISTFPALIWRSSHLTVIILELTRWSIVAAAFTFFAFFGFADEARKHYRLAFRFVGKRLGFSFPSIPTLSSFGDKKKAGIIPLSNSSQKPTRSLRLPHLTSIAASRDSISSVAATSIRKSDVKSDCSSPTIQQTPPPAYKTFPMSPNSPSTSSLTPTSDPHDSFYSSEIHTPTRGIAL